MACWIEKGKGIRSTGELSGKALLIGWCLSRGDECEGVEVCGIWKKNVIGTVIIWNTWLSYYPSRNTLLPRCGQLPFSVFLYALVFTSKIAFIIRCCIVHVCVCFSQLDVGFLRAGTSDSCLLSIYLMAWLGVRYPEILIKKWVWPYGPHSYNLIIFTNEM